MKRALLLLVFALVLAGCGGGDDDGDSASGDTAAATTGAGGCSEVDAPEPREEGGGEKQTALPDGKAPELVVETNCGSFTIALDEQASPKTVASVAGLAEAGFYDDTTFHRIVPGFVIQGGDPTGTGTGGPGYSTRDAVPRSATYTKGVVAMAKTQTEPPGTAGSQFFVVTAGDAGLPPEYALLGRIVKGQDVVDTIGELGDPASGSAGVPLQPVVIEKTTVQRR